jgi:hypothetical protein
MATKVGCFQLNGAVYHTGYTDRWGLLLAKAKADIRTIVIKPKTVQKRFVVAAGGRQ